MFLPTQESDTIDFKESWSGKALKDLAAFANTRGGTVYVGVRDGGVPVGTAGDDPEQLLIANHIDSKLRITADITLETHSGVRLLRVTVPASQRLPPFDIPGLRT